MVKTATNRTTAAMPAATSATTAAGGAALQSVVFGEIQSAALPVATAKNFTNLVPVDEGVLGDFPWSWQVGTNVNAKTYTWLNSLFGFESGGYVGTNGETLTTALSNVLLSTAFVLNAQDAAALNAANLKAGATVNTLITDWTTTQGPIPNTFTTQAAQLNYIATQVLGWGSPGLTLNALRTSTNPMGLLPNIPLGADQIVSDLMTYLAQTSSVANIQAAVVSFNQQIHQTIANLQPLSGTVAPAGYMVIVNDAGGTQVVPQIQLAETTAVIQNSLLPNPPTAGTTFSAGFTAVAQASNQVQITSQSGAVGVGDLLFFMGFGETSTSNSIFSFDSSLTTCQVNLTFNGVTAVTPLYKAYDISTTTGWWNPTPIRDAANPVPNQSGYAFNPKPAFNFGVNGDFGVISRLLISQQPVISLTYNSTNISAFQQVISQHSSWGVSFLGIALAGGSSSYYKATATLNEQSNTITVTMSPAGAYTPVSATDQLAYVIGAQLLWPGATATQNAAGF